MSIINSFITLRPSFLDIRLNNIVYYGNFDTRETRPFITERLLMGREESNQTIKQFIMVNVLKFQTFFSFCSLIKCWLLGHAVIDLGLISFVSLGPKASTKVESHVNFTESQKVSQPNFFAILNTEKLAKTIN